MSLVKQTTTLLCVGYNRYVSVARGTKSCYIACLDQYPEQTDDQAGLFALSTSIPYDQAPKIKEGKPSLDNPLLVTLEGSFQNRAGNMSFVADNVLSVKPYKSAPASASASASNPK